jgi:Carbohydrate family 9 binding domain-like
MALPLRGFAFSRTPVGRGGARGGGRGVGGPGVVGGIAGVVALAALVGGCVDRGAGPNPGADPQLVARSLLREVPAELTAAMRVDAALALPPGRAGGAAPTAAPTGSPAAVPAELAGIGAIYLGAILETDQTLAAAPLDRLVPGQALRIRHFWRVVQPLGDDLRVFTYLRGDGDAPDFMNLDDSPLRRAHPPARWRAGEILQDVQTVVLRPDWRSPTATLLVGLMRRGGHDQADRLVVRSGPAQSNAVVARTLPVELDKAPPPPGTLRVPRATSPIVVDGIGNDAAWAEVPWSASFPTAEGSADPVGSAQAKLSWDEHHLYVLVRVEDTDIASPYRNLDDPLWKADCIELFIDADSNRHQYIELQVNPHNAQFDSYFATTRAQPGDPSFSAGMTSQVVLRGTVDQSDDQDAGWDAELAIPWAAVRGKDPAMAVRLPPQPGDKLRLNVVRVDKRAADKHPTASSWNRITYADFHALDRMLNVVLTAPPTPAPTAAPATAPPSAPTTAPQSAPAPPVTLPGVPAEAAQR